MFDFSNVVFPSHLLKSEMNNASFPEYNKPKPPELAN